GARPGAAGRNWRLAAAAADAGVSKGRRKIYGGPEGAHRSPDRRRLREGGRDRREQSLSRGYGNAIDHGGGAAAASGPARGRRTGVEGGPGGEGARIQGADGAFQDQGGPGQGRPL